MPHPQPPPAPRPGRVRRRRDRRGRGLRGPLLAPALPAARTRAERFDELVLDAVDDLDEPYRTQLADVEFAVELVPPADPSPWESGQVPLGRYFPGERDRPATVVVYRRPVEGRAEDGDDLADLVTAVVVEQVSAALGVEPERLHPRYRRDL